MSAELERCRAVNREVEERNKELEGLRRYVHERNLIPGTHRSNDTEEYGSEDHMALTVVSPSSMGDNTSQIIVQEELSMPVAINFIPAPTDTGHLEVPMNITHLHPGNPERRSLVHSLQPSHSDSSHSPSPADHTLQLVHGIAESVAVPRGGAATSAASNASNDGTYDENVSSQQQEADGQSEG